MTTAHTNPCGLDGFAFLEFSGPDASLLHEQFKAMGFVASAKHRTLDITKYSQGEIDFIVNAEPNCQAAKHAATHGPAACAMGFRVQDAQAAFVHTTQLGATPFHDAHANHGLAAISAIGGSVIYFVDQHHQAFGNDWIVLSPQNNNACGLKKIDHLTHNVYRGHMDQWADFYIKLFGFREIRFFNIVGQMTGLISRAMASPCDKIKIPLNESKDEHSQIEEFLHEFKGEGIQHIALTTDNIYETVPALKGKGLQFLDVPSSYYDMIDARIPWHQENIAALATHKILIDGTAKAEDGLLLQIFTENIFGPVFFEIIQRKGNQGFGEGNFQALFEAIERDQIRRGTLVSE